MLSRDYMDPAKLREHAKQLDQWAVENPRSGFASQARALRSRADAIEQKTNG